MTSVVVDVIDPIDVYILYVIPSITTDPMIIDTEVAMDAKFSDVCMTVGMSIDELIGS